MTSLLNAVGKSAWIQDESLIDAVTGLSGSGPAYVFLLVEAMATDNGLGWHNVVSVRISAQVWAQPVPLELLLRTEVDLETGQVALAELAA